MRPLQCRKISQRANESKYSSVLLELGGSCNENASVRACVSLAAAGIVCRHLNLLLLDVKPQHKKLRHVFTVLAFDVNKTLHGFF